MVNTLRFYESPSALVFCNTRDAVRHLQATLLERGFSVVALSGELTQNERTQALQALRDGRARICVATDVAARGIDLPNLDLVIHADIPNDAEVMQHRSGRTGRAGRKGVSVLLVPPARKRRAELLLNLAKIDAVWGVAPTADEIRKLDQERMLQDAVLSEEPGADDLVLAKALLAERSPEQLAVALARMYRARLPSPEDILDPGQAAGRTRDARGRDAAPRPPRGDDRGARPASKPGRSSSRHEIAEGGVWFRAAIGRRKNAEARWLLPMICRRGGIDRNDIGAIRILDTTTEFEISSRAAEAFAGNVRRPDKEDNIRIEPLQAPHDKAGFEPRPDSSARGDRVTERQGRPDRPHDAVKPRGNARNDGGARFDPSRKPGKAKHHAGKPPHAGQPKAPRPFAGKSTAAKKAKKNRRDRA